MKTIGVLGGIGPQATMDFEARIHRVAQQRIPPNRGSGYPPMVVYYFRHAPFLLTDEGGARLPYQPDPRLLETAKQLGQLADFLAIVCNSIHMVQAEIEQAAGRKVLSMIDVTVNDVRRRQWKRVGVVGFGDPVVYTQRLNREDVVCETIDTELRAALDVAIFRLMEGRADNQARSVADAAVAKLRATGVDGVILGCTEIPLLLCKAADSEDMINPLQLLAEAAVSAAIA